VTKDISIMDECPGTRVDVDAGLVEALRRDDPNAVDELVARYADRVYRLAMRITGSNEDAEEAAKDALGTAARQIHTFKDESAFGSWIDRITANAAYRKLRSRRPKANAIALDDVLPSLDSDGHFAPMDDWSNRVDERALQGELRQTLTDAIEALPPDYRAALVLHDVEGVPEPDIAEALGISLPGVKSRVHRSRLFVRKRLSEYLRAA
jgi:RNA polymerase sigma-70 factor, ECF subfamily